MVANSRTSRGAGRLRQLNRPQRIRTEADDDSVPVAVYLSNRRIAIESTLESWRIDDEWWRKRPIARVYWRVLLEDGRIVDVFHDLVRGDWFRQTY